MRKSYHIESFILVFINVVFGILLAQQNWSQQVLLEWGAMSKSLAPTMESLSSFPPFFYLHDPDTQIMLSGTPLLIIRSIYASFLQFSWVHLANNVIMLFIIGKLFENTNYPGLLTPIYLITGSISMLSAYYLNPNTITAGASGAIFGLLGVCLVLGYRAKWLYRHDKMEITISNAYARVGDYVYGLIVYNLIMTFVLPEVSIVGHVAGLISGLVIGLIIPMRKY